MANTRFPYIPEYITVHLGTPDSASANVEVPFAEYIKNVASSEIYPTWPEDAIIANIYAQISFALNRIYLEQYRSRGYDFDITNSTKYDQAYKPGREIFENISRITDDIFNNYLRKQGSVEPYPTSFCNGTTSKCEGLSQWGSVDLANQGYTPLQIVQYYYGDDIELVQNAPVQAIKESYPGFPLRLGSNNNQVKIIQDQLNRISQNYPAIPRINNPDGVFGVETENAVKKFQEIFDLTPDGVVGKATWYKIKSIYNAIRKLYEFSSEGLNVEDVTDLYPTVLKEGMVGNEVKTLQYYLDIIGYFNPGVPLVTMDGIFGPKTKDSVIEFQKIYGLTPDGIVGKDTWLKLDSIYKETAKSTAPYLFGKEIELYPGYTLKLGLENEDVKHLQTYLEKIAEANPSIPKVEVSGVFDQTTKDAVQAIQKQYSLPINGNVGALTWGRIIQEYTNLVSAEQNPQGTTS